MQPATDIFLPALVSGENASFIIFMFSCYLLMSMYHYGEDNMAHIKNSEPAKTKTYESHQYLKNPGHRLV